MELSFLGVEKESSVSGKREVWGERGEKIQCILVTRSDWGKRMNRGVQMRVL